MTPEIEKRLLDWTSTALETGQILGRKWRLPRRHQLRERLQGIGTSPPVEVVAEPAPVRSPEPVATPAARVEEMPRKQEVVVPPRSDKRAALEEFAASIADCQKCSHLAASRQQVVFGVGNPDADLMFVGEAPGADEDRLGEPFVGRAGQLLTKVIQTMGLQREEIYIANILKCRPDLPPGSSGNRPPRPEEMATCQPYLEKQLAIIEPKVIVALGGTAINGLLGGNRTVGNSRGRWFDFQGVPLRPTFHPSYILRRNSVADKRLWWEDMLAVMEKLGYPISEKQRAFFQPR